MMLSLTQISDEILAEENSGKLSIPGCLVGPQVGWLVGWFVRLLGGNFRASEMLTKSLIYQMVEFRGGCCLHF